MSRSTTGRNWGAILGVVFAALLVLSAISYVWFPFLIWGEQRDAGEQIVRDQVDADVALDNYRWFRQQWFDIQAQREQVKNARDAEQQFHETYGDDPSEWSRTAETRHGRLHDRITGAENVLEEMTADYNARSADATRSMFKCHLPYKVDERFRITGPPGSGTAEQPQDQYVEGADPSQEPPKAQQCDGLPSQADS